LVSRLSGAAATTLGALARRGEQWFKAAGLSFGHGTTNARDEAIYLTLHTLGLPLGHFPARQSVTPAQATRVIALFKRRIEQRRPAAYLTQEAWLGPHRFFIDERALVPRSYIAELLLQNDALPFWPAASRVHSALDLCTGSGCLAILLGKHFRQAHIDAADLSKDALDVARINVRRHRLTRRITLVESDYFRALKKRRYDLVISNPPYVRSAVMKTLPREYRREPALALAGGSDGLDAVRIILSEAVEYLNPGGILVVECGHARERVERAWPWLPFLWPETSGGDDCVFVLSREDLVRSGALATAAGRAALGGRASQSVRRRTSSGSNSLK
jgi:ribosomal protein L3 glutamine methyltransferase